MRARKAKLELLRGNIADKQPVIEQSFDNTSFRIENVIVSELAH